KGEDQPFFLYLAYNSPHWPLHAKPEDIKKYKGHYDGGYQEIRNSRYQRMIEMGVFDEETAPLFPEEIRDWNTLSDEEKAYEAQNMEIHAAMVDNLDQNIGRVVSKLEQLGELDNTVIFFFTDNGASHERDQRAMKNYQPTGEEPVGSVKTYECIGKDWGRTLNAPFAKHKANSDEGGIRTPMIGYWPKGMREAGQETGGFFRESAHLVDMMSTAIELAGTSYPSEFRESDAQPIEGASLVSSFKVEGLSRKLPIFFHWGKHHALIDGEWKIIREKQKPSPWRLFNLVTHQTETENLAEQNQDKVKELGEKWIQREAGYQKVSEGVDMDKIRNTIYKR
ncbi:MAG: sulfatase-like hydrolase/transferase, partial [Verrucomicrobiota bacterium]